MRRFAAEAARTTATRHMHVEIPLRVLPLDGLHLPVKVGASRFQQPVYRRFASPGCIPLSRDGRCLSRATSHGAPHDLVEPIWCSVAVLRITACHLCIVTQVRGLRPQLHKVRGAVLLFGNPPNAVPALLRGDRLGPLPTEEPLMDRHAHLRQLIRTELKLEQRRAALRKALVEIEKSLRDVRKQLREF